MHQLERLDARLVALAHAHPCGRRAGHRASLLSVFPHLPTSIDDVALQLEAADYFDRDSVARALAHLSNLRLLTIKGDGSPVDPRGALKLLTEIAYLELAGLTLSARD